MKWVTNKSDRLQAKMESEANRKYRIEKNKRGERNPNIRYSITRN